MTPRIRLTRRARIRIFDRCSGMCCGCLLPIQPGERWEVDHLTPLHMGGSNDEMNLVPRHRRCHEEKNAAENTTRSKTDRQRANHLGIPKSRKQPLPGGRDSGITMTMSNGPQCRKSQTEKHRETMANRYSFGRME